MMNHESYRTIRSRCDASVTYRIRRMSFGARVELMRRMHELSLRIDFDRAGTGTSDRLHGALLDAEVNKALIEWGLVDLEGLEIEGAAPTPLSLLEQGPEEICREIADEIRHEAGLTEDERKN